MDIEAERVAAADRADARQRQIEIRDLMPAGIAAVATVGFFGLLSLIAFKMTPSSEAPLNVVLGALGEQIIRQKP